MKKCIQFSLFTLLISFGLNVLSMEEYTPIEGTVRNEYSQDSLSKEKTAWQRKLEEEKNLSNMSHWTYDPRVETERRNLYVEPKENITLDNVTKKIGNFFSDLWNGFRLKQTKVNTETFNDLFKKLTDAKKLDVINHFVKKEVKTLDKEINIARNASQAYQKLLQKLPVQARIIADSSNLQIEATLHNNFNNDLNKFRLDMDRLIQGTGKHLVYNKKTKEFNFGTDESLESRQPTGYTDNRNRLDTSQSNNPTSNFLLSTPPIRSQNNILKQN